MNSAQLREDLKSQFYHAIGDLLTRSAIHPRENQAIHLAAALAHMRIGSSIAVIWSPPFLTEKRYDYLGARWSREAYQTDALPREECEKAIENLADRMELSRQHSKFERSPLWSYTSEQLQGQGCLVFSTRKYEIEKQEAIGSDRRTAELWLISGASGEEMERFKGFIKDGELLTLLYRTFRALIRAGDPARLAHRVARIRRNTGVSFMERLVEACEILEEIHLLFPADCGDEYSGVIVTLAEAVMNEMLGVGWDVQNAEGLKGNKQIRKFLETLNALVGGGEASREPSLRKLSRVGHIIEAILSEEGSGGEKEIFELDEDDDWDTIETDVDLDLMARWTQIYQTAKWLSRDKGGSLDKDAFDAREKDWARLAKSAVVKISLVLGEKFKECHEVLFLPSWLRLWFCHILLIEECKKKTSGDRSRPVKLSAVQRWRLRRDLAYVIRECLRLFRYGKSPNFMFQPIVFSNALRTLVEHHAISILNLPRSHDIRGFLREIGRASGNGDYYFAAGHLQHVLEIYIAGQFYLDLKILGKDDDSAEQGLNQWTMEEVLASRSAWKPGNLKCGEFRKAFSLAALLHDVGLLLFPYWSEGTEGLGDLDEVLRENMMSVRGVLDRSAGDLLKDCDRELREEGYDDPTEEPQLARSIADCIQRGIADHCVLGAWYLHRICQNVEEISSDTVRQAVRAILLHRIVSQKIEVDRDPAAALLVVCDEIFMWKQGQFLPAPDEIGRSFQSIAVDVRPQASPFDYLRLEGLGLQVERRRLVGVIDLEVGRGRTWPRFEIMLKDPDYLDTPVAFTWLMLTQNLGRIVRSNYGWAPSVELWSKVPGRLESCGLDTKSLLDEVANLASMSLRPSLERWLSNDDRFVQANGRSPGSDAEVAAGEPKPRHPPGGQAFLDLIQDLKGRARSGDDEHSHDLQAQSKWECVRISSLRHFHNRDIVDSLKEIGRLIERVLHDEELFRSRPHRLGRDSG